MRWILRAVTTTALLPLALSAQSGSARYVAPSDATIVTHIEEGAGATRAQIVYVTNRSTVPIIVYSFTLRECENIKQSCDPRRMNLKVRAGARAQLGRVEPKNPLEGTRFNYSFGWRVDSTAQDAALKALAASGSSEAREELAARDAARAQAAQERRDAAAPDPGSRIVAAIPGGDVWIQAEDLAALGDRIVGLRAEPDSLVLQVDQLFLLRRLRIMAVDSSGKPLGRVAAGMSFRVSPGVVMVRGDTVAGDLPGRGTIEIRLAPPAKPLTLEVPVIVRDSVPPPAKP